MANSCFPESVAISRYLIARYGDRSTITAPAPWNAMGFGEETVRARNQRIIYVSISGFGEMGPYADQRVYDPVIQALSGATDIQANRLTREPEMFRVIIADKVSLAHRGPGGLERAVSPGTVR